MLFRVWQATPHDDSLASGRAKSAFTDPGSAVGDAVFPAEVRDCVRDTRCPQHRQSCAAHNLSRLAAL